MKKIVGSIFLLALAMTLVSGLGSMPAQADDPVGPLADFDGDGYADLAIGVIEDNIGTKSGAGGVNVLYGGTGAGLGVADSQHWHLDNPEIVGTAHAYDYLGQALAAGDFTGNGWIDLAVGIPGMEINGDTNAGAVLVLYSGSQGLTHLSEQVWHQDRGSVGSLTEEGDQFGWSLAAGDFNGDGKDDLAIGVPFEDWNETNTGIVQILYGSTHGLTDDGHQLWRQGEDGLEDFESAEDKFGYVLAVGNLNFDDYADLVIGVPHEDLELDPTLADAGVIHVLYGSADGLSAVGDQFFHQALGLLEGVAETGDKFGWSLAAGDFDNYGCDSLAVGVPGQEVEGEAQAGAIHVLLCGYGGLMTIDDYALAKYELISIHESGDQFGWSLAAGNFDGDAYVDLAIGTPYDDVDSGPVEQIDAGTVIVAYGYHTNLHTRLPDMFYQGEDLVDGPEHEDHFGWSLAAGDFDGDNRADLAIGVPGEDFYWDTATWQDAGSVHVLYGAPGGISEEGDQLWHQDGSSIRNSPANDEGFGFALAAIPTVDRYTIFLPLVLRAE